METKQFTIRRSEWGRAPEGGTACGTLYDWRTGAMCCLGFFCRKIIGLDTDALEWQGDPRKLDEEYMTDEIRLIVGLLDVDRLIELNDRITPTAQAMTAAEQERAIAEEFRNSGFEVVFRD